ncbi:ATP-binding protein, partial [Brachyspira hampsonii]|nr:ATP-binding protein [Brachyspira hampsonii]
MENHFVKNICFENFKCFKKLEFDGFKRVNLIGGKNNVGKTSFMEGVNLAVYSEDALKLHTNIRQMIKSRQNDDIDIDFFNDDE